MCPDGLQVCGPLQSGYNFLLATLGGYLVHINKHLKPHLLVRCHLPRLYPLWNSLVARFLHFVSCTAEAQAKFLDNTDGFPLLAPRPAACVIMILFCSFVKRERWVGFNAVSFFSSPRLCPPGCWQYMNASFFAGFVAGLLTGKCSSWRGTSPRGGKSFFSLEIQRRILRLG